MLPKFAQERLAHNLFPKHHLSTHAEWHRRRDWVQATCHSEDGNRMNGERAMPSAQYPALLRREGRDLVSCCVRVAVQPCTRDGRIKAFRRKRWLRVRVSP